MSARHVSPRVCIAAALVALGCSHDAVAPVPVPDDPLSIGFESPVTPSNGVDTSGAPYLICVSSLKTDRPTSSTVTWTGATVRFFAGPNRTLPVDSASVDAATVQGQWHTRSNDAGDVHLYSAWQVGAYIPFSVVMEFRYHYATGVPHVSTAQFDCGPVPPPSATPPAVSGLTVAVPSDPLSWGDSVIVTANVASASGLWQTVMRLSGPCEFRKSFVESYATSVTHRVKFIIPRDCGLGLPFLASVFAVDALGRDSLVSVTTTHMVADTSPPSLSVVVNDRPRHCCPPIPFIPFAGGDSIGFTVVASDNRLLRYVVWELLPTGVRDSVAIPTGQWYVNSQTFKVRIPPAYIGNPQLRVFVRDDAGLTSPVFTSAVDTIRVLPSVLRPIVKLPIAGNIVDMVLDAARGHLYVLGNVPNRIDVVSMATKVVLYSIPLARAGASIDRSATGDSLFVLYGANGSPSAAIGVVNLAPATPTVTSVAIDSVTFASQAFGANEAPVHVRAAINGKVFVSTNAQVGPARVYEIDFVNHTQRKRYDAAPSSGGGVTYLDYSGDRTTFIASVGGHSGFTRYNSLSDTFVPAFPGVVRNAALEVDPTGARVVVGGQVYDAGGNQVAEVIVANTNGDGAIGFSADGLSFYSLWDTYGLMRTAIGTPGLADRTVLPTLAGKTLVTPDGRTLLLAVQDGSLYFVDIR